ncbi:uncharacterized protein LOC129961763 [Argiope bruennichi]|uniref:Uncharacterized protein n=1 Tax=Argiope bruennichi TaxID=94029 RepID=A0A8T0FWW8_ARGBR|nr:uncharacterized protein LOC129961763 [Argiope bruennichi]XP_055931299.1 uncharacterized protein LOC129961763 [Argiope bruennichi]KAF8794755.1 hypothetical protein HNY73_002697 [Argiope bruennichi]
MILMETKSEEKEKTGDIQKELQDTKTLSRPRNFSLQRRREVYYFSEGSGRGILKRVPIKDGIYRMNEQKTVLDNSDAAKSRNEIWTDIPLNTSEGSMVNKNNAETKNDDSYESLYHDQEVEAFVKSLDKIARYKPRKYNLNNPESTKPYKNNPKAKDEDQDPMKIFKQTQTEDDFYTPIKGHKKKKQQSNASLEIDSEKLKGSISDEELKKLSISKKISSSSKNPEALKDSRECLSERWTQKSLNDALNKISLKAPTTEL